MSDDELMIGKEGVDPLTRGPGAAKELFSRYSRASKDFTHEAAMDAAANILMNSLRQQFSKRKDADEAITRLLERVRGTLGDHYNHLGDRRSVFPFHQVISVPGVIQFKNKF